MSGDPEAIYLSVACNPDYDFGRMWSENGDGPDCACGKGCTAVRYVQSSESRFTRKAKADAYRQWRRAEAAEGLLALLLAAQEPGQ